MRMPSFEIESLHGTAATARVLPLIAADNVVCGLRTAARQTQTDRQTDRQTDTIMSYYDHGARLIRFQF